MKIQKLTKNSSYQTNLTASNIPTEIEEHLYTEPQTENFRDK